MLNIVIVVCAVSGLCDAQHHGRVLTRVGSTALPTECLMRGEVAAAQAHELFRLAADETLRIMCIRERAK